MMRENILTFASCDHWYSAWLAADAEYDWLLDPWDQKMGPFPTHGLKHAPEPVKYHSPLTTIHCSKGESQTKNYISNLRCVCFGQTMLWGLLPLYKVLLTTDPVTILATPSLIKLFRVLALSKAAITFLILPRPRGLVN